MRRIGNAFIITALCLATFSGATRTASAQGPLTAAAIIAAARMLADELNKLGPTLGGNAGIAINGASGALDQRIRQFEAVMKNQLNVPIINLTAELQEMATELQSAVTRLDTLLKNQQRCFFQNAELLISGAQNITSELRSVVPFRGRDASRVLYYKFENQPDSVVPQQGGRFTVLGYQLWETRRRLFGKDQEFSPVLELMTPDRTAVIATLVAQRAGDDNSVSARIDGAMIAQRAGQCLQLRVKPGRSRPQPDLYMPMCVPAAFATTFQVKAYASYSCVLPQNRTLEERQVLFFNNDMVNRINVAQDVRWDVPANCEIVDFTNHVHNERGASNVNVKVTGRDVIGVAGWLDDAEDFNPPIGPRILLRSTIWDHRIAPIARCQVSSEKTSNTQTANPVPMTLPTTTVNLTIPKECESNDTTFWYTVSPLLNNQSALQTYESPRITANINGASHNSQVASYELRATYNPKLVGGNSQFSLTVTAPQACR